MESGSALTCSQLPATGAYPEPDVTEALCDIS